MSARHLGPAFRHLHLLCVPDAAEVSDAQLLGRFVSQRDQSAFELLVWRHGPMIHGLCRRLLRDGHDADDAFQATLLVLAKKADSIGKHESIGSWLYKVAYRIALRARDVAQDDLSDAREAEARGQAAGMASLAERCARVWEIAPAEDANASDAACVALAGICASVALGPVLPPDRSTLFGVRGAMQRLALLG